MNSSYCYSALGNQAAALRAATLATEAEPGEQVAWITLGVAYHKQSRFMDAIKAYERAVSLSPGSSTPHYNIALARNNLGQLSAAAEAFKAFLAVASQLDERRHIASEALTKIETALAAKGSSVEGAGSE